MAIVRILKNGKCGEAIKYNDSRCKLGEAKLLTTNNLSSLYTPTEFFKLWSEKNKRVKNPVLHAVISIKGNNVSDEKLEQIGKEWLEKMGYGDNPYMIYVHNNTNNKHIHLVASRIKSDGSKVSDSFEKERAIKCLNSIENVNQDAKNRKLISSFLKYSFSTRFQFMELCKKSGFKIWVKDECIYCKKAGSTTTLPLSLVEFCSNRYHKDIEVKQKKKIQSLIYKYASQLTKENFVDFMKEKFGLDFIFYGKDGTINGFTIIDNQNQSVYKGSEVFGLKKLTELLDLPQNPDFDFEYNAEEIFKKQPYITYDDFCIKMAQKQYIIEDRVITKLDNGDKYYMNDKLYNRLQYNNRLIFYSLMYRPRTADEAFIVSKLARVQASDLLSYSSNLSHYVVNKSSYEKLMQDCIAKNLNLKEILSNSGITLVLTKDNFFLLDSANHVTIDGNTIGIDFADVELNIKSFAASIDNIIDESIEYSPDTPIVGSGSSNAFGGLLYVGSVGTTSNKNKRKRHSRK